MKNNLMVRLITSIILISIILTHLMGQTNLLSLSWLWLAISAAFMGLQATFTGWCPSELIAKLSKTGECCPRGGCDTNQQTEEVKENVSENCCSSYESSPCCDTNTETLTLKVLGTGCASCNNTAKLIESTANELNRKINLIKVEDIAEIASYGVMSTPAVVISEQVVHSGGIPSKIQITSWLTK